MSKRVLILFAVGFLAIVAGIFVLKYELSPEPEPEFKDETEADIEAETAQTVKPKKTVKGNFQDLPINKTLTDEQSTD